MQEEHRKAIQRNFGSLVEQTDLDVIVSVLYEKGVFSEAMIEPYKDTTKDVRMRKRDLYRDIERRGPTAFPSLLEALTETGHWDLVRALDPDSNLHPRDKRNKLGQSQIEYVCLWDVCGHKSKDPSEIVRHINYHAYHARLLAIGFNGRATLKLVCCKKDSNKRNVLPPLPSDHYCMWVGCSEKFDSIQAFFDHVTLHINYAEPLVCSWAGCGATFTRRTILATHARTHTGEKLIACYHCGQRFGCNRKLCDHLRRQNASASAGHICGMCGQPCASAYLLRQHTRSHVSVYACTLCDMTAPTLSSLANHVRYRHLGSRPEVRVHACKHCDYRAITKWDLNKHVKRKHQKKVKKKENGDSASEPEQSDEEEYPEVKKKEKKKYICHMCPEKKNKIFTIGTKLTSHLVKVHGVQWPFGHSRFRYQISEDGMYRLTTTRYESLEVSKKIVDGSAVSGPIITSYEFEIVKKNEATENTPNQIVIGVKGENEPSDDSIKSEGQGVEITMCDVDEHGNIISSEVIQDVLYS